MTTAASIHTVTDNLFRAKRSSTVALLHQWTVTMITDTKTTHSRRLYSHKASTHPIHEVSGSQPYRHKHVSMLHPLSATFYNQQGKRVSHQELRSEYFQRRERLLNEAFGCRMPCKTYAHRLESAGTLRSMPPLSARMSTTSRSCSAVLRAPLDINKSYESFLFEEDSACGRQSLHASRKSSLASSHAAQKTPKFHPHIASLESSSSEMLHCHQQKLNRALTAHVTRFHAARRQVEHNRRVRSAVASQSETRRESKSYPERFVEDFMRRPAVVLTPVQDEEKENRVNIEPPKSEAPMPPEKNDKLTTHEDATSRRSSDPRDETSTPDGKGPRKSFGLRVAVADFTKKVKDNEGMGINTFTYLEEDESSTLSAEEFYRRGSQQSDKSKFDEEDKKPVTYDAPHLAIGKELTPIGKLRRGIKTVILITKAITTKTEQTRKTNRKYLTFAEVEDEVQAATLNQSSLAFSFDLSYFKARKEKTLSAEAALVFRVHPHMRTEEMIRVAMAAMNNTVEAFSEFPQDMQRSLVQRGYYETFGPKRVIIRQGHAALNFYFIISGITMVSVARQNKLTGDTYGETVAFLKKGNSFGELALMYGGKRSATVSCKTEVELLAVSRDDFIDIFMNLSTNTEPEHIQFLRNVKLLNDWPIDELPYDDPSVCMFAYFRRGTVLSRDSNTSDWIYIIKTGTCRIIKDVPVDANTKSTLLQTSATAESKYRQFLHNQSLFGSSKTKRKSIVPANKGVVDESPTLRLKGKLYIQMRILGPGDTFGLEPVAFEILGGTTSMTLVSDGAECIGINKGFFKRFVTEPYLKGLRQKLQAFPNMSDLQAKLGDYYDWDAYRQLLVEGIGRYKDGLAEIIQIH